MMNVMCVLVLATVGHAATATAARAKAAAAGHYTQQWAVGVEGGAPAADAIAQKHGFTNLGPIVGDRFLFVHSGVAKRSADPSHHHHQRLVNEPGVSWARQQVAQSRRKRDLLPLRPRRGQPVVLNDPRWPQMWYLNRGHGLDMNVQPAWQQGVSGKGVVVTILDDGLEKDHPDLYRNYDPQASYDVNNHDEDPMPRYDLIDSNRHGTRCAGEVAATANNSICAVGVAFGASVGGVRMLDGDVTDAVEARSLSLNPQHIDIYSASWGPDDDGKTVDGPGELATRAFIEGVSKGRNGKGSIFVWASGNGGRDHDNCNCDGYTNSIWTLSISSATENGLVPWYSEACSSTLATTYSSGSAGEKQVLTTDLHHQCTSSHTGTSASAPLAAGICALALESNRDLTWRDMQHIVVRTAKPANLRTSDWKTNGVGRNVSHSFGYGLMDASAMVRLARVWKSVPEQHKCEVSAPHTDKLIPAKSQVLLQLHVRECAGINFLEHVQAKISLASSRRGDLQIHLTSPAGTRTTLLARRPHDISRAGFQNWPFMSVHTWGEKPFGIWILEIHNEGRFLGRATLQEWALVFYGTAENPYGSDISNPASTSHSSHNNPSSQSGSSQGKGARPSRPRPAPSVISSPYAVNSSPRKGKNRAHKNNPSKSSPYHATSSTNSGRPSVIEIRRPTMPPASRPRVRPNAKSTVSTIPPTTSEIVTLSSVTKNMTTLSPTIINGGPSLVGNFSTTLEKTTKSPSRTPDTFPEYPIVQQLYPLYALSKLEGLSSGKGRVDPSSFRDSRVNLAPSSGFDLLRPESHRPGLMKGTLHDWKLVLYGTDTAPGINLHPESSLETGEGDSSLGPSSDEEPLTPVDDQKENPYLSKETDIVHNDILHTTTENDALSSGCVALSKKGQDCIECLDGQFLYEGRCVVTCPTHTVIGQNNKDHPACMSCHYSCKTCFGANDDQCSSCYSDSFLDQSSEREKYCYPIRLQSALNIHKWLTLLCIAFFINISLLVLVIYLYFFTKQKPCVEKVKYSKLNQSNDKIQGISRSNCKTSLNISDSESES